MKYNYVFTMTPGDLHVTVHVGTESEFNLPHPHLWTGAREAEVWFPSTNIKHSDVAHEGVHLLGWAQPLLQPSDIEALVPRKDMARRLGWAMMVEEAAARMMDRYIDAFYDNARKQGLRMGESL